MNLFKPVRIAAEVKLVALRARSAALLKEIEATEAAHKLAVDAEAKVEAMNPSKPKAAKAVKAQK